MPHLTVRYTISLLRETLEERSISRNGPENQWCAQESIKGGGGQLHCQPCTIPGGPGAHPRKWRAGGPPLETFDKYVTKNLVTCLLNQFLDPF